MKCNQLRPGFELVLPCPFPMMITITPRAPHAEVQSMCSTAQTDKAATKPDFQKCYRYTMTSIYTCYFYQHYKYHCYFSNCCIPRNRHFQCTTNEHQQHHHFFIVIFPHIFFFLLISLMLKLRLERQVIIIRNMLSDRCCGCRAKLLVCLPQAIQDKHSKGDKPLHKK